MKILRSDKKKESIVYFIISMLFALKVGETCDFWRIQNQGSTRAKVAYRARGTENGLP